MLKTFNCGVGFCIVVEKKILIKLKNILLKTTCLMKLVIFVQKMLKN